MKETLVKCNCDYCNKEINEYEYENAVEITIRVDMPDKRGGCGECGAVKMKLCDECSERAGIINLEEYHKYIDSQNRLIGTVDKCKKKILKLFLRTI